MGYLMTSQEFVNKLNHIANNVTTTYAKGMFGTPITQKSIDSKSTQKGLQSWYATNKPRLQSFIGKNAYGFDCVCLFKGILWGWSEDFNAIYGGATYASNGVPDFGDGSAMSHCTDVSSDMSNIVAGEWLWMEGHVGAYVGNGKVVECTMSWTKNVLTSNLSDRKWLKHGKAKWIDYGIISSSIPTPTPQPLVVENLDVNLPTDILLKRGSIGLDVKILQFNLNKILGCKLSIDGEFGDKTREQVIIFQGKFKLTKDGKVGKFTATKINEVRNKGVVTTVIARIVTKPTGWVADLQTALNNAGYRDKNGKKLVVDNKSGQLTLSACPTLSRGSKNAIVGVLQARLNSLGYVLTRDNDFGQKTHDAVILYQRAKGLKQDGIVGAKTWTKLLGL